MKRLITVTIIILIMPLIAIAGSSRIVKTEKTASPDRRFRIYAEGDTISNLTISASDYTPGSYIYGIETIPSSPDAVYDVAVQDSDAGVLCDATGRSTTAKELFDCSDTTGKYEKVYGDLTVAIDDLGAGSSIIIIDLIGPR